MQCELFFGDHHITLCPPNEEVNYLNKKHGQCQWQYNKYNNNFQMGVKTLTINSNKIPNTT